MAADSASVRDAITKCGALDALEKQEWSEKTSGLLQPAAHLLSNLVNLRPSPAVETVLSRFLTRGVAEAGDGPVQDLRCAAKQEQRNGRERPLGAGSYHRNSS